MLLIAIETFEFKNSRGLTLLEVVLVISLSAGIFFGLCNFFLSNLSLCYGLRERSEGLHQLRTGLAELVSEIQKADPETIRLLKKDLITGHYTQIQFSQLSSSDLYWFYLNSKNSLIRALKRPSANWGRTSLATTIDQLFFQQSEAGLIQIKLVFQLTNKDLILRTAVFPGFNF